MTDKENVYFEIAEKINKLIELWNDAAWNDIYDAINEKEKEKYRGGEYIKVNNELGECIFGNYEDMRRIIDEDKDSKYANEIPQSIKDFYESQQQEKHEAEKQKRLKDVNTDIGSVSRTVSMILSAFANKYPEIDFDFKTITGNRCKDGMIDKVCKFKMSIRDEKNTGN